MTNFISTFGSRLLKETDYELWYEVYYKLNLNALLKKSVKHQHHDLTFKLISGFKAEVGLNELLIYAASNGHLDRIKFLVDNGVDIHAQEDQALIPAANGGYLDIVKFLLANGADIHFKEDRLLIDASSEGHLDLVKFFS